MLWTRSIVLKITYLCKSIRFFVSLQEFTQKRYCKQANSILMARIIRLYELTWEFEKQVHAD
jgi:hypothetical protein